MTDTYLRLSKKEVRRRMTWLLDTRDWWMRCLSKKGVMRRRTWFLDPRDLSMSEILVIVQLELSLVVCQAEGTKLDIVQ